MKFLICNIDVPFDVMSAIAIREGIDTPVLTKPFDNLTWCIACGINDFHRETIPTLVDEYNDMYDHIGVGDPLESYTVGGDFVYEVYQTEHDGYTIIYVEEQEDMDGSEDEEDIEMPMSRPNKYGQVTTEQLETIARDFCVFYVRAEDIRINRMRLIMAIRQDERANDILEGLDNGGEWEE